MLSTSHANVYRNKESVGERNMLTTTFARVVLLTAVCQCSTAVSKVTSRDLVTTTFNVVLPLRRQVRAFAPGRRSTIKILYVGPEQLDIRWFRTSPGGHLPNAEIADMLATEGDAQYDSWSLRSGNIRATVLRTPKVSRHQFPFRFATVFSKNDGSAIYRIDTVIVAKTDLSLDVLNGIRWTPSPVATYIYPPLANVSHKCRALLDTDDDYQGFTNTLTLHRHRFNRSRHHMVTETLAQLRNDLDKFRNRTGNYRYAGKRVPLDDGGAKYVLTMKIDNASKTNEAVYTCEFVRELDRAVVSTLFRVNRPARKPGLEVLPCESNNRHKNTKSGRLVIYLKKGRETCFRCRASGHPAPEVNVIKDGAALVNNSRLHIDHHVNVVEGRLAEKTYTIWNPLAVDDGIYQCEAENKLGKASIRFKIVVLQ